eukprot:gene5288-29408_t
MPRYTRETEAAMPEPHTASLDRLQTMSERAGLVWTAKSGAGVPRAHKQTVVGAGAADAATSPTGATTAAAHSPNRFRTLLPRRPQPPPGNALGPLPGRRTKAALPSPLPPPPEVIVDPSHRASNNDLIVPWEDGLVLAERLADAGSEAFAYGMLASQLAAAGRAPGSERLGLSPGGQGRAAKTKDDDSQVSAYDIVVLKMPFFDPKGAMLNRQNHCTISGRGFVYVEFAAGSSQPSREFVDLERFSRERKIYTQMRALKTFKQYQLRRMFGIWRQTIMRDHWNERSAVVANSLLHVGSLHSMVADVHAAMVALEHRCSSLVDLDRTYTLAELVQEFTGWVDRLRKEFGLLSELQGKLVCEQCRLPRSPPGLRPSLAQLHSLIQLLHHMTGGALLRLSCNALEIVASHVCDPAVRAEHAPLVVLELLAVDRDSDAVTLNPTPLMFKEAIAGFEDTLLACEDAIQPVWGDVLEENLPPDMFEPSLRLTMPRLALKQALAEVNCGERVAGVLSTFAANVTSLPVVKQTVSWFAEQRSLLVKIEKLDEEAAQSSQTASAAAAVAAAAAVGVDQDGSDSATPMYEDRFDTKDAEVIKVRFDLLGDSFNHLSEIEDSGPAVKRAGFVMLDTQRLRAGRLLYDAKIVYTRIGDFVVNIAKQDVDNVIREIRACKTELQEEPETVARFHTYNECLDVAIASSWKWMQASERATWHLVEKEIRTIDGLMTRASTLRSKLREEFREGLSNSMAMLHRDVSEFSKSAEVLPREDSETPSEMALHTLDFLLKQSNVLEGKIADNVANQERLGSSSRRGFAMKTEDCLDRLRSTRKWLSNYELLWKSLLKWNKTVHEWRQIPIRNLKLPDLHQNLLQYDLIEQTLANEVPYSPALARLRREMDEFKKVMSLLEDLQSPSLKAEHWEQLRPYFGQNAHGDSPLSDVLDANISSRTRQISNIEKIATVTRTAIREHVLSSLYESVSGKWKATELKLSPFPHQLVGLTPLVLEKSGELVKLVHDTQVQLAAVTQVGGQEATEGPVFDIQERIELAGETIDQCITAQENWTCLAHIFLRSDISKNFAREEDNFRHALQTWGKITTFLNASNKEIVRQPDDDVTDEVNVDSVRVLKALSMTGLLEALQVCNAQLQHVKWTLEGFLESRRQLFPRMYFLNSEASFRLLNVVDDPAQAEPFFPVLFSGIKELVFKNRLAAGQTSKSDIVGVHSDKYELLKLQHPVRWEDTLFGGVEGWLRDLERGIILTMRHGIMEAVEGLHAGSSVLDFILRHPGQICVVTMQIHWTRDIEAQFKKPRSQRLGGLKGIQAMSSGQAFTLSEHLRGGKFTEKRRATAEAAMMLYIYFRDSVTMLVDTKVTRADDWSWRQHIRMELESPADPVVVRQGLTAFKYGYEYLGSPRTTCITPLTLRAFTTLTSTLQRRMGGVVVGESQSGKKELIQTLADTYGRMLLRAPFLEVQAVSAYMNGMAKSGVWTCFHRVPQASPMALSLFAERLRAIKQELDAIPKVPGETSEKLMLGCFLTLTPPLGHKTTVLPQSLRALFRPIAVGNPDIQSLCEALLTSKGFMNGPDLALKLSALHKRLPELLPPSVQSFTFRLRCIKDIISQATSLRDDAQKANSFKSRAELALQNLRHRRLSADPGSAKPSTPEGANVSDVLQTVRDTEAIKHFARELLSAVVPDGPAKDAISALVLEIFGRQVKSAMKRSVPVGFSSQISLSCIKLNYEPTVNLISKVQEAEASLGHFRGIIFLGDAGSGKSTTIALLLESLALRAKEKRLASAAQRPSILKHANEDQIRDTTPRLFPNSLSNPELYWKRNPGTQKWVEGAFPTFLLDSDIMEGSVSHTHPYQVLVCDGKVENRWAEGLATAVDENQMLSFGHSPRVPVADGTRLLFECSDCADGSPALLSRCGLINIGNSMPWQSLVKKWSKTVLRQYTFGGRMVLELQKHLLELVLKLVPPALEFYAREVQSASSIAISNQNLVKTFVQLISGVTGEKSGLSRMTGATEAVGSIKVLLLKFTSFSWIWAFGGNLDRDLREKFKALAASVLHRTGMKAAVPKVDTFGLFDYFIEPFVGSFTGWSEKMTRQLQSRVWGGSAVEYLIWTPEVMSTKFIVNALGSAGPVFIYGPEAAGKTILVNELVADWAAGKHGGDVLTGSLSPHKSYRALSDKFRAMLTSKTMISSKKRIHLFVDDVNAGNVAQKDSAMASEMIRQLLSDKSIYDPETRTLLKNKHLNATVVHTESTPNRKLDPRFLTHFAFYKLLPPTMLQQQSIFQAVFEANAATAVPSMDIVQIVAASINIFDSLKKHLNSPNADVRHSFSLRHLSRLIISLAHAPTEAMLTSAAGNLFCHEVTRIFGDRLRRSEDKFAFDIILEEFASKCSLSGERSATDALFGDLQWSEQTLFPAAYRQYRKENMDVPFAEAVTNWATVSGMRTADGDPISMPADSFSRILQLSRIVAKPRGHAVVFGPAGTGKKTMVHMVSVLQHYRYVLIDCREHRPWVETHNALKILYTQAGIEGRLVMVHVAHADNASTEVLKTIVQLLTKPNVTAFDNEERQEFLRLAMKMGNTFDQGLLNMSPEQVMQRLAERVYRRTRLVITIRSPNVDSPLNLPWEHDSGITSLLTYIWHGDWASKDYERMASTSITDEGDPILPHLPAAPGWDAPAIAVKLYRAIQTSAKALPRQVIAGSDELTPNPTMALALFKQFLRNYRRLLGDSYSALRLRESRIDSAVVFYQRVCTQQEDLEGLVKGATEMRDKLVALETMHDEAEATIKDLKAEIEEEKKRREVEATWSRQPPAVLQRLRKEAVARLQGLDLSEMDAFELFMAHATGPIEEMLQSFFKLLYRNGNDGPLDARTLIAGIASFKLGGKGNREFIEKAASKLRSLKAAEIDSFPQAMDDATCWLETVANLKQRNNTASSSGTVVGVGIGAAGRNASLTRGAQDRFSADDTSSHTPIIADLRATLQTAVQQRASAAKGMEELTRDGRSAAEIRRACLVGQERLYDIHKTRDTLKTLTEEWESEVGEFEVEYQHLRNRSMVAACCATFSGFFPRVDRARLVQQWVDVMNSYFQEIAESENYTHVHFEWPSSFTRFMRTGTGTEKAWFTEASEHTDKLLIAYQEAPWVVGHPDTVIPYLVSLESAYYLPGGFGRRTDIVNASSRTAVAEIRKGLETGRSVIVKDVGRTKPTPEFWHMLEQWAMVSKELIGDDDADFNQAIKPRQSYIEHSRQSSGAKPRVSVTPGSFTPVRSASARVSVTPGSFTPGRLSSAAPSIARKDSVHATFNVVNNGGRDPGNWMVYDKDQMTEQLPRDSRHARLFLQSET